MTSVYYVNIACYVTKERFEAGFSATQSVPVRVEATSPEEARQKVGEILSEAIAATEEITEALRKLNKRVESASQGDTDVG